MDRQLEYMNRCLDLARGGIGKVAPNPLVGCVIVKADRILAEGYHQEFGGAHAEVNAINQLSDEDLKGAELYVSLEPCSHYGKTPPCSSLIIAKGIKRVFIGALDPNPLVAGNGRQALISAGVEVEYGIQEEECQNLNKQFYHFHHNKLPYITLKWAETEDGFIGRHAEELHLGRQISNEESKPFVHGLRAKNAALMIGANTANIDNPKLTTREVDGANPIKIILSKDNRIRTDLQLFQEGFTLVFNSLLEERSTHIEYIKVSHLSFLDAVFEQLYNRNIQTVLVEGGAQLLQSLIDHGYWNEAFIIKSPKQWSKGVRAPQLSREHHNSFNLGDNQVVHYIKH